MPKKKPTYESDQAFLLDLVERLEKMDFVNEDRTVLIQTKRDINLAIHRTKALAADLRVLAAFY